MLGRLLASRDMRSITSVPGQINRSGTQLINIQTCVDSGLAQGMLLNRSHNRADLACPLIDRLNISDR